MDVFWHILFFSSPGDSSKLTDESREKHLLGTKLEIVHLGTMDHSRYDGPFFTSHYSRQQNYSSTCDNTCDFSLVLLLVFNHIMLVINNIIRSCLDKHLFHKIASVMSFFDPTYLKCSINFAVNCTSEWNDLSLVVLHNVLHAIWENELLN